jgi:NADH dehydrogenase FAD-containing subunit
VVGSGVAALEAALTLRELAADLVEVELVAPEPKFWYRPLAVAEQFGLGQARSFDLGELARRCAALFTLGTITRATRCTAGATVLSQTSARRSKVRGD